MTNDDTAKIGMTIDSPVIMKILYNKEKYLDDL